MSKIINGDNLTLGTCYYPEHWPKTMWREDLERMKKTGIEVIRIAEFAWSKIEPEEGVFTYEFFDEFLDLADEVGMKVIFCTPTATPPAWLTEKYPEVLNARMDGVLLRHGARRHYNYNSPVYQELSARITGKSASHYAKRDCIIGWQLDNEINCEVDVFYSESDTIAFRRFLKEKYGTIDALNEAWGTAFWNQTYTDWKEVYVPRTTISDSTNPHEVLDYTRFVSASARQFAKMQSDIIRRYLKPGDFITTNGLFGNLDNHAMRRESLDFITYDSYPNFAYCLDMYSDNPKNLRDRKWSPESDGDTFGFAGLWHYGAAVRSKWVEYPYGGTDAAPGTDHLMDDAVDCAWSGLHQLLPLENVHDGDRNLLAWHSGLLQP